MYYLVYRNEPFLQYLKASFIVGLSLLIFYRLQPIRFDQPNGFWLPTFLLQTFHGPYYLLVIKSKLER